MKTQMVACPILNDDIGYSFDGSRHPARVVSWLDRDEIFRDFFTRLQAAAA